MRVVLRDKWVMKVNTKNEIHLVGWCRQEIEKNFKFC